MDEQPAQTQGARRDPAASMLLLRNIELNALDPSYRDASERRHRKVSPGRRVLTLVLAIVVAFASTAAVLGLRGGNEESARAGLELAEQVQQVQNRVNELFEVNSGLADQVQATEAHEGVDNAVDLEIALGSANTRVTGPGVLVTVDPRQAHANAAAEFRDTDLRAISNLLWEAGAEAQAINGNRLGPDTSVRLAGSAILVNLVPLSAPYVIEAVGDPGKLWSAIRDDAGAQRVGEIRSATGATISTVRAENLVLGALPLPSVSNAVIGSE